MAQARALMHTLRLGELRSLEACTSGIENTNYFVSAEHDGRSHAYVFTVFERLSLAQLPFFLRLMKHLAVRGLPVPEPQSDAHGELMLTVQGKPAVVVNRLPGASEPTPGARHCAEVGAALARLHLAAVDLESPQPNSRALPWWNESVPLVLPFLTRSQQVLIQAELDFQNQLAATLPSATLPRGPIHADLFRDNVLFETFDGIPKLSGIFDFYFAGVDTWVFDLAVCLNDWCISHLTHTHEAHLAHYFVSAYESVRPLLATERALLPAMLRAAALRFWISRLRDQYLPRQASVLCAHDPGHFEQVLQMRSADTRDFAALVEAS